MVQNTLIATATALGIPVEAIAARVPA
jgi:hypothetical protein